MVISARPPVSPFANPVTIQSAPFNVEKVIREVTAHNPEIGAVASFIGVMREMNDGDVIKRMTLEHYPGMTEKAIAEIVEEARERWELVGARVIHRVGTFEPTDPIVLVVTAATHRGAAFDACEFIMDYLKTRAPFWKKETTRKGERWVASRESDREAADRWRK